MKAPRISVGGRAHRERTIEQVATALTRTIVHLQNRQRKLRAELAKTRTAIKTAKRELRVVLQRSSTIDLDSLDVAGKADGADRAIALAEQRPTLTVSPAAQATIEAIAADLPKKDDVGF